MDMDKARKKEIRKKKKDKKNQARECLDRLHVKKRAERAKREEK